MKEDFQGIFSVLFTPRSYFIQRSRSGLMVSTVAVFPRVFSFCPCLLRTVAANINSPQLTQAATLTSEILIRHEGA